MSVPAAVFLDTSVLDSQNYNYQSVALNAFMRAARESGLTLLLPEPTEDEMLRHVEVRSDEAARTLEKAADEIRRKAPFLMDWVGYKQLVKQVPPSLKYHRRSTTESAWRDFWKQCKVERLGYDGVSIKEVMTWYRYTLAPFGKAAAKRKEFPDAIALAILLRYAEKTNRFIAVVSSDNDFRAACDRYQSLLYFPSIANLTELLLSQDQRVDLCLNSLNANTDVLDEQLWDYLKGATYRHDDRMYEVAKTRVHGVGVVHIDVIAVGNQECTISFEAEGDSEHELAWDEDVRMSESEWAPERRTDWISQSFTVGGTAKIGFDEAYESIESIGHIEIDSSELRISKTPRRW